jgi:hypothetical protein
MIRQAISCDICAAEKRQTNHWFVAYEQGGELRVSGWTSRHRLRQDSKHLCGQTCLHKLVDEFMAKSIARRSQRNEDTIEAEAEPLELTDTSLANAGAVAPAKIVRSIAARAQRNVETVEVEAEPPAFTDTSLTNVVAATEEVESSARLLPSPEQAPPKPLHRPLPEIVTMPSRPYPKDVPPLPADTLRYASRRWHAEAWERERERELRAIENHPELAARRRNSA